MAVGAESSGKDMVEEEKTRTEDPGVRVVGGNICDSKIGKSCHQCRQKTMDSGAACKKLKKDQPCTIKFCHKCLLNRYGEKVEEVDKLEDWNCPKCRGVCNCSCCMKRKGFQPTGCLTHAAKQSGFTSVHELLDHHKGSEFLISKSVPEVSSASVDNSPYKGLVASERTHNKDSQCVEEEKDNEGAVLHLNNENKNKKKNGSKKNKYNPTAECEASAAGDAKTLSNLESHNSLELPIEEHEESSEEDIVLPQGSLLHEVSGIDVLPEDVGCAIQFMEFCNSFAKVFDMKKGQAECILRDLVRGGVGRRGLSSSVVRFHIKLLSLLEEGINDDNWIQALGRCIANSKCQLDNLPEDAFNKGLPGYDGLEQTEKLRILNFLCDETLGTLKLRNWIDEEIGKFVEEKKETKEKVLAVRKEEKILKQKLRDKIAQTLISGREGAPFAPSEHDDAILEIRTEADREHAELLKTIEDLPKKKHRCEASGMDPILLEGCGRAYWKLRSFNDNSNILLQVVEAWDYVGDVDTWYFFNVEEERILENHISSARNRKRKRRRSTRKVQSDDKGVYLTGAIPIGPQEEMTLTCPTLEKIDKVKAIMDMRASE